MNNQNLDKYLFYIKMKKFNFQFNRYIFLGYGCLPNSADSQEGGDFISEYFVEPSYVISELFYFSIPKI
jgi:hypothetical protein